MWDDPITPTKLSVEDFCKPCEVAYSLDSDTDSSISSQDTEVADPLSCDLEPDIKDPKPIPKCINTNTLRGRRSAHRLRKRKCKMKKGKSAMTIEINVCGAPTMPAQLAEVYNISGGSIQDTSKLFQLIWDTGASHCITFCKEDFSGGISFYKEPKIATGLAQGLKILGEGQVNWEVQLNDGTMHVITLEAYYIPGANRRLLSPQQLLQHLHATNHQGQCRVELTADRLTFHQGSHQLYVEYDVANNLPVSYASKPMNEQLEMNVNELNACLTINQNANLSKAQKELLRNHFKFGHMDMQQIQEVLRTGALARSQDEKARHLAASKVEDLPKCAACPLPKQSGSPCLDSISPKKTPNLLAM